MIESWTPIEEPAQGGWRFFKVGVGIRKTTTNHSEQSFRMAIAKVNDCLEWYLLAGEWLCRVVPIVLVCAVVLAAVVGGLWLIGRVARLLGGE